MEQSKLIKDLIERVDELGMTLVVVGSEIEIRGSDEKPDEQEMVATTLIEHKDEVIDYIKEEGEDDLYFPPIEE